ncbi:hypothetical protein C8R44DRAFT_879357 [Mycena epipterygia]|nr:hypothetical protein C8R44DRAFT_879357 [Mycena epipterygia]
MPDSELDDLCPVCGLYPLTRPAASTGFHNMEHIHRVYQKCRMYAHQNISLQCSGFIWRDDLSPAPWGPIASPGNSRARTTPIPCISASCATSRKPRAAARKCTQLFCKDCCTATSTRCAIAAHNRTFAVASPLPLAQPSRLVPPAFAGPYGRTIDPTVMFKLEQNDFGVAPRGRMQTQEYHLQNQKKITVIYWAKNNELPIHFSIAVGSNFPYFHPQDAEVMTIKLGRVVTMYEYLQTNNQSLEFTLEEDDQWIATTNGVRVKADSTWYLRDPDVTTCLGLRATPRKRSLSNTPAGPPPSPSVADTPSPTKRPRTEPDSRNPVIVIDEDEDDEDDGRSPIPFALTALQASSFPFPIVVSNSIPSLPRPQPPAIPRPLCRPHTADMDARFFAASAIANPTFAPQMPQSKRIEFPLAYACDMDARFHVALRLGDSSTALERFQTAFGYLDLKFHSSTFSDSWIAWRATPPEVLARAVASGYGPGGEWSLILKAWRKGCRAKIILSFSAMVSLPLTRDYLWSLNISVVQLVAILEAHQEYPFGQVAPDRPATKPPRQQKAAIQKILDAQIAVDWAFVAGTAPGRPGSPTDILIRQYITDKLIVAPFNVKVEGSTCSFVLPVQPVPAVEPVPAAQPVFDEQLEEIVVDEQPDEIAVDEPNPQVGDPLKVQVHEPIDVDTMPDPIVVDEPNSQAGDLRVKVEVHQPADEPIDVDTIPDEPARETIDVDAIAARPVKKEVVDPTDLDGVERLHNMADFYQALEHTARDQDWKARVLVKDCTRAFNNAETVFAPGVSLAPDLYGPSPGTTSLYVPASAVIAALFKASCVPNPPWELWFCLPGFPWMTGPFARQHRAGAEVERDHSFTMFREIPVTGAHDALRIMVIFRHPEDSSPPCVPGLENILPQAEHINGLTPYSRKNDDKGESSGEDEEQVEPLVKAEEDVKPPVKRGHISEATAAKHAEIEEYMRDLLLPANPWIGALHHTKETRTHTAPPNVPDTWDLIQKMAQLRAAWPSVPFTAPRHLHKIPINKRNWRHIFGRGETFMLNAAKAEAFITDRLTIGDPELEKFLKDSTKTVGVGNLIDYIGHRRWLEGAEHTK